MTAAERATLSNALYAAICPLLEQYEAPGSNAHTRTQIIMRGVEEQCLDWIIAQSAYTGKGGRDGC
jgi:hypothetical protein